jgi:hypothetical protein
MTDRSLMNRLERLEADQTTTRQRIVWIEPDETQDQALSRVKPLEPCESPLFIGWGCTASALPTNSPAPPTGAMGEEPFNQASRTAGRGLR